MNKKELEEIKTNRKETSKQFYDAIARAVSPSAPDGEPLWSEKIPANLVVSGTYTESELKRFFEGPRTTVSG